MNIVIGSSIGGACIIYEVVAVIGYFTFGSKVGANIMAMYPSTSLFIACGQLAIVILVLFSYPLQVHPCRNCLDKIVDAIVEKKIPAPTSPTAGSQHDEELDNDHEIQYKHSHYRHIALTAAIIASGFPIAYFISSLQLGKPFYRAL
jgi:amino acid permease